MIIAQSIFSGCTIIPYPAAYRTKRPRVAHGSY